MKLSKKSWIILIIFIPVIILSSLGVARSQQAQEQKQLSDELYLAGLRLNKLRLEQPSSRQKELEEQLRQTLSQLETAEATSPQPVKSIEINSTLLDTAKTHGVEVIEIGTSGPASGNLEGIPCRILTLTARVEGDAANLTDFIINLTDNLANSIVTSLEIRIPQATGSEKASANIKLAIYSYQGD